MGWGLAAMAAMQYLSSREQSKAARQASQPLPTYYKYLQSPEQQQMFGMMEPTFQSLFGGGGPSLPGVPAPTAGWYGGLDANVRAGIEEPYMRSMDMMRNQLSGAGMLGAPRAGMSGAAADVFGQYAQQAAPAMAQTAWGMMQPGLLAQQQQGWEANMLPYQMAGMMMPQMMPDMLVGHTPTIAEAGSQPEAKPQPSGPAPDYPPGYDPKYRLWGGYFPGYR